MFNINDDSLIDGIAYCIQDQGSTYVLDLNTGRCFDSDSEGLNSDFVPLPPWSSSQGFRLMASFVEQCRDKKLSADLSNALKQGKGVFRRFRSVLDSCNALSAFYSYRDDALRSYIRGYLREKYQLRQSPEVLLTQYDTEYVSYDKNYILQNELGFVSPFLSRFSSCLDEPSSIVAKTHDGKPCAILSYGFIDECPYVFYYYVCENRRRRGLFSLLLNLFMSRMIHDGKRSAAIPVPKDCLFVSGGFQNCCFDGKTALYSVDISRWKELNISVETCYLL